MLLPGCEGIWRDACEEGIREDGVHAKRAAGAKADVKAVRREDAAIVQSTAVAIGVVYLRVIPSALNGQCILFFPLFGTQQGTVQDSRWCK